jgi:hypothetical protein
MYRQGVWSKECVNLLKCSCVTFFQANGRCNIRHSSVLMNCRYQC